jgi:hypothetical protein
MPLALPENTARLEADFAHAGLAVTLRQVVGQERRSMHAQRPTRDVGKAILSRLLVKTQKQDGNAHGAVTPPDPSIGFSSTVRPCHRDAPAIRSTKQPGNAAPPCPLSGGIVESVGVLGEKIRDSGNAVRESCPCSF